MKEKPSAAKKVKPEVDSSESKGNLTGSVANGFVGID